MHVPLTEDEYTVLLKGVNEDALIRSLFATKDIHGSGMFEAVRFGIVLGENLRGESVAPFMDWSAGSGSGAPIRAPPRVPMVLATIESFRGYVLQQQHHAGRKGSGGRPRKELVSFRETKSDRCVSFISDGASAVPHSQGPREFMVDVYVQMKQCVCAPQREVLGKGDRREYTCRVQLQDAA